MKTSKNYSKLGIARVSHHHLNFTEAQRQACVLSCSAVYDLLRLHDCSLSGSSVHGISQARILEWIAIFFSRGSSRPRDQTCLSCIGR